MLQLTHFNFEFSHRSEHRTEKVMASITAEMLDKVLSGLNEFSTEGEIATINLSRQINNSKIVSSVDTVIKADELSANEKNEIYTSIEDLVTTPATIEMASESETSPASQLVEDEAPLEVETSNFEFATKKSKRKAIAAAAADSVIKILANDETNNDFISLSDESPAAATLLVASDETESETMPVISAASSDLEISAPKISDADDVIISDETPSTLELSSVDETNYDDADEASILVAAADERSDDTVSIDVASCQDETPLNDVDLAQKNMILAGIRIKNQLKAMYGDSILNDATLTIQMTYAKA